VAGARESLEQATAADATLLGAELGLAHLYEQAGAFDDAAKRYRKVLALRPNDATALNNLAYLLAVYHKAPAEALPLAKRAHELTPASASVTDTLGWIHHLLGDDKLALPLLTDAMRRAPRSAEIHLHAAVVSAAAGRPSGAAAALGAALLLDPSLEKRDDVRGLKDRLAAGGWMK
jgi:Tfp pilus assembly protein PilF